MEIKYSWTEQLAPVLRIWRLVWDSMMCNAKAAQRITELMQVTQTWETVWRQRRVVIKIMKIKADSCTLHCYYSQYGFRIQVWMLICHHILEWRLTKMQIIPSDCRSFIASSLFHCSYMCKIMRKWRVLWEGDWGPYRIVILVIILGFLS